MNLPKGFAARLLPAAAALLLFFVVAAAYFAPQFRDTQLRARAAGAAVVGRGLRG